MQIEKVHIPPHWQENLIAKQKIGGVFLVFLSGESKRELNRKVKLIKDFCKRLKTL